ncbi:MAG: lamin tail domain-containing protein, partial [Nocardioides sp.]
MSTTRTFAAGLAGLALAGTGLVVVTAPGAAANPAGDGLVISEVYGGGGNSGATYTHDFVELYNPTGAAIPVGGLSVQYRSSSGGGTGFTNLTGSVEPGRHYLVQEARGNGGTQPLPAPDATGGLTMSSSAGSVALVTGTGTVPPTPANTVDLVGYGSTALREGDPAPGLSNTTAATRDDERSDSDDNADDFTEAAPDPQNSASTWPPEITVVDATIADIQGTRSSSPYAGRRYTHVRTRGVVTAAYPAGGFYSFVIQTEGTGGGTDATPGASDGLWVYQARDGVDAEVGDFVEVTG